MPINALTRHKLHTAFDAHSLVHSHNLSTPYCIQLVHALCIWKSVSVCAWFFSFQFNVMGKNKGITKYQNCDAKHTHSGKYAFNFVCFCYNSWKAKTVAQWLVFCSFQIVWWNLKLSAMCVYIEESSFIVFVLFNWWTVIELLVIEIQNQTKAIIWWWRKKKAISVYRGFFSR